MKRDFSSRINALEQRSRINNIEIVGLKKPSLMETDTTISLQFFNDTVNAGVSSDDIEALHEVPSRRKDNKRIVVVHFKSRHKRDTVLAQSKIALRLHNSNTEPASRIYANEHLSPDNKRLFAMATKLKYDLGYKFVWSKKGVVYLKKDEMPGASFHKITCEEDLAKVT